MRRNPHRNCDAALRNLALALHIGQAQLLRFRELEGAGGDAGGYRRGGTLYRSEREYGSFYRTIPLPEGVALDDIKATFADGVLEVSVPLPPEQAVQPRKVQIEEPKAPATAA